MHQVALQPQNQFVRSRRWSQQTWEDFTCQPQTHGEGVSGYYRCCTRSWNVGWQEVPHCSANAWYSRGQSFGLWLCHRDFRDDSIRSLSFGHVVQQRWLLLWYRHRIIGIDGETYSSWSDFRDSTGCWALWWWFFPSFSGYYTQAPADREIPEESYSCNISFMKWFVDFGERSMFFYMRQKGRKRKYFVCIWTHVIPYAYT